MALTTLRKSYIPKPSAGDDLNGDSFWSCTAFITELVQVFLAKCKKHWIQSEPSVVVHKEEEKHPVDVLNASHGAWNLFSKLLNRRLIIIESKIINRRMNDWFEWHDVYQEMWPCCTILHSHTVSEPTRRVCTWVRACCIPRCKYKHLHIFLNNCSIWTN